MVDQITFYRPTTQPPPNKLGRNNQPKLDLFFLCFEEEMRTLLLFLSFSCAYLLDFDPSAACQPFICNDNGGGDPSRCGIEGSPISQAYGDQPGIDVSYTGITSNTAIVTPYAAATCPRVQYWSSGYGGLVNIAYSGESSAIGTQIAFVGSVRGLWSFFFYLFFFFLNFVTVISFQIGGFGSVPTTVQVWDIANPSTPVFSLSPTVGSSITVTGPWISTSGIVIQIGPDGFLAGIDNIEYEFEPIGVE